MAINSFTTCKSVLLSLTFLLATMGCARNDHKVTGKYYPIDDNGNPRSEDFIYLDENGDFITSKHGTLYKSGSYTANSDRTKVYIYRENDTSDSFLVNDDDLIIDKQKYRLCYMVAVKK